MPMDLITSWVNATRVGDERARVEKEYRDFLIDHFGGVEQAFQMKQEFKRAYEPPRHPWHIATIKGRGLAVRSLKMLSEERDVVLIEQFVML